MLVPQIGFREKLQDGLYFVGKTSVSSRFSVEPIDSITVDQGLHHEFGDQHGVQHLANMADTLSEAVSSYNFTTLSMTRNDHRQ